MALTPVGTNVVTSLARRTIIPVIADNVYKSNALFFRLYAGNKKIVQGGYQIELPLMYQAMAAGGPYSGTDQLNITPSDTVINAVFPWAQHYVPITIDGLTQIKMDQPIAIANLIRFQFKQAEMQMADNLGVGLWSDANTNPKQVLGLTGAVDTTLMGASYGGLAPATYPFWQSQLDNSTAASSLSLYQSFYGSCTFGGRHPTIIFGTQATYNFFYNLNTAQQRFPSAPGGSDELLANAGFTNLLFNNIPFVVDSHILGGTNQGKVFFLNENYLYLYVSPRADFTLEDFQTPVDQDVMVAKFLWAGNLCTNNRQVHGKLTALTS
jgi:hypothetical protein